MNAHATVLPSTGAKSDSGKPCDAAPEHQAARPERVMVCMNPDAFEPRLMMEGARIGARLRTKWYAVYVARPDTRDTRAWRAKPRRTDDALQQNIRLAAGLGATIVRVKADRPRDGLLAFARREGITHVMVSESAESRWAALWRASTIDWMLSGTTGTAVLVVPADAHPIDPSRRGTFELENGHLDMQRHSFAARVKSNLWWALALIAMGALFAFRAPAIVCLAAAVVLAVWWCRDLDAETR